MSDMVGKKYIKRHKMGFVYFHWINAICFFVLFCTGLPLWVHALRPVYDALGPHNMQILHRVFAVIFIANPIIALFITAREGVGKLISEIFRFDGDDVKFLVKFPGELIGKEPEGMPKQGFYNGGERMNIALQMLIWLGLVTSGLVMWLAGGAIDNSIRAWMIPLHSICAGIGFAAAIGHIYLAVGVNPDSVQGMKDGTVKATYAEHHHTKWVDELVSSGRISKSELDEALKH